MIVLLLLLLAEGGGAVAVSEAPSGEIAEVQAFLKDRRLYDGEITGRVDHRTAAALRRYQMMHRLRPSGRLDAETEGRMSVEKLFPVLLKEDRQFLEAIGEPPSAVGEKAP